MIAVLVCYCPNAEPKAYKFLQNRINEWMTVPVYRGKEEASEFLRDFTGYPPTEKSPQGLAKFLEKAGSFIIIVGYDNQNFGWSDISHNDAKSEIDAELLLERFA